MKLPVTIGKRFTTVFRITVSWTIISMVQLAYEAAIMKEYGLEYRWSTEGNFMTYFFINTFSFLLNGFIAGLVIVFFIRPWIRDRSYGQGLLYSLGIYTVLFFCLTCVQNYFVINSIWDKSTTFLQAYLQGLKDYFFSFEFVRNFPFWLIVLAGTLIILFINDKYGPGNLRKFLLGRYFHPKIEKRIFMFLDLKSSTSIAERLGESRYFSFLQKVFKDVTPDILETKAEIYQYVGDEIVLSWDIIPGRKNQNCIRCFARISARLQKLKQAYIDQFGVAPEFKAGIHVGFSVIGEIGIIKRDIVYSGDVLNTTSRIQGKCNELGVTLLFSQDLLNVFPSGTLSTRYMGEVELRGKAESLKLYSLSL